MGRHQIASSDGSLPINWEKKKLSEVLTTMKGKKPKLLEEAPSDLPFPYINIKAFEKGIVNQFTDGKNCTFANEEDVLIVWDGARCGLVGKGINGVVGSTLAKIVSHDIYNRYIYYFLQSQYATINSQPRGVGIPHVDPGIFWNIDFPLAPYSDQERIVSKIEELFTQLDAAEAALLRAKKNLKRYQQSLLQAAVTGELTKEWREAHKDDLEPASKLLERIKAERKAKWEAEIRAKGKDPAKEKYKEPKIPDVSDLPVLPDGWCWVKTEDLVDVGTGATPLRSKLEYYEEGNIPWVTSGSLNNLFVEKASEFITILAIRETNVKLFPKGSLLIALYGEGKTRGKVSELKIDSTTNQAIAALVFNDSAKPTKQYMKIFFRYNYDHIRRLSSGGVQPNLNLSIIKNTRIPLPSIQEQREILIELENKEIIMEEINQSFKNNLLRIKSLRNSILYQAFTGKLITPQIEEIE